MHILRVLGSRLLPCGCFVGRYETYDGATVEIVDEVGVRCDAGHRNGCGVPADETPRLQPSAPCQPEQHAR